MPIDRLTLPAIKPFQSYKTQAPSTSHQSQIVTYTRFALRFSRQISQC